jgi:hypothetical protein
MCCWGGCRPSLASAGGAGSGEAAPHPSPPAARCRPPMAHAWPLAGDAAGPRAAPDAGSRPAPPGPLPLSSALPPPLGLLLAAASGGAPLKPAAGPRAGARMKRRWAPVAAGAARPLALALSRILQQRAACRPSLLGLAAGLRVGAASCWGFGASGPTRRLLHRPLCPLVTAHRRDMWRGAAPAISRASGAAGVRDPAGVSDPQQEVAGASGPLPPSPSAHDASALAGPSARRTPGCGQQHPQRWEGRRRRRKRWWVPSLESSGSGGQG